MVDWSRRTLGTGKPPTGTPSRLQLKEMGLNLRQQASAG